MIKSDKIRLKQLLEEIDKIFSSNNPKSYSEIIPDINKELKEILNRK